MKHELTRISNNVLRARLPVKSLTGRITVLFQADVHWDNPHCDRKLYKKHLDEAIERDAYIAAVGDIFCLMQGKYDRRGSKSGIRPEHSHDDYFDRIRDDFANFYKKYADRTLFMSEGNHETAVSRRAEFDVMRYFMSPLGIEKMPEQGWIILQPRMESGKNSTDIKIHFDHYNNGGEVTKGALNAGRKAAYLPDAHACVGGHIHEALVMEITRDRIHHSGAMHLDTFHHVICPTYKDEYSSGSGYHTRGNRPPKPLGAWWMHINFKKNRETASYQSYLTWERAQ